MSNGENRRGRKCDNSKEAFFESKKQPLDAAQTREKNRPESADIRQVLAEVIERIGAIEDNQQVKTTAIKDIETYISDLKKDLNSIRRIRLFIVIFSIIYVVIVNFLLGFLIWRYQDYFLKLSSYTQTVFIIFTISSTITISLAILRGAFKTYNERHKEELLPPNLQSLLEMLREPAKSAK